MTVDLEVLDLRALEHRAADPDHAGPDLVERHRGDARRGRGRGLGRDLRGGVGPDGQGRGTGQGGYGNGGEDGHRRSHVLGLPLIRPLDISTRVRGGNCEGGRAGVLR